MRKVFAPVLLAAALTGCREAGEFTTADSLAVDSVRLAFMTAYNAGDASGVAALYTENALSYQGDQAPQAGRAAIQERLTAELAATPRPTLDAGSATRIEGEDDMAIVAGPFTMRMGQGDSAMTMNGKYLVILKKGDDGRWLLAYNSSSMNQPMMPPAPPAPARRR